MIKVVSLLLIIVLLQVFLDKTIAENGNYLSNLGPEYYSNKNRPEVYKYNLEDNNYNYNNIFSVSLEINSRF